MYIRLALIATLLAALPLRSCFAQQPSAPAFPRIEITISPAQYSSLKSVSGSKLDLRKAVLLINGDTADVKEVHSRGNNSLNFARKSLSVDLKKGVAMNGEEGKVKIKKFDLLNLVMDKNLWHNRWAFINLAQLDIFPLYNSFCTLKINGVAQGIYLLVEKPHYAALKNKSPFVIRRGLDHAISDEYGESSKEEIRKYRKQYLTLYRDVNEYHGQELYNRLNAALDIEHYFGWIAFNFLVMNGDYEDEVFFFIRPETGKYDIIPWDYDDLFRAAPHEGLEERNSYEGMRKKWVFSSEDPLDRAIATDDYLYAQYLTVFEKMFNVLSQDVLASSATRTSEELKALSLEKEFVEASLFLDKTAFRPEDAQADIEKSSSFVINRRATFMKEFK